MPEKVVCNKCGADYTDRESIEQVRKWIAEGCAPCPNMLCMGQLEIKEVPAASPATECSNCGYELTNVFASRSVELQLGTGGGDKWIEKNVFMSGVCCPNCHKELTDEEISELGIEGY